MSELSVDLYRVLELLSEAVEITVHKMRQPESAGPAAMEHAAQSIDEAYQLIQTMKRGEGKQ